MFLDDDFLDRGDAQHKPTPDSIVSGLKSDVPPALVLALCTAMLERLDQKLPSTLGLENELFACLKLITQSDKPQAALDFVEMVILRRPDDSSWHRQALTPGLLNALPANTARSFLRRLVSGTAKALDKQA